MTRQLLAFSRRQVLEPKVLDLNAVVEGIEKLLLRLIGEDIELITELAPKLPAVKADPTQIEQVLLNLAVNARDAMPHGGRLVIATARAELGPEYGSGHPAVQPGRYAMLAVSDTGCGMDAQTRAHAFEPFFTTKEQGRGTGLGLSTVYGIVKQSGGDITLESAPEAGTTFKVYLPAVEADVELYELAQPAPADVCGQKTILLVEDNDDVREMIAGILRARGHYVVEARDGVEGIAVGETHPGPIHLLMTDMVMPKVSGRDVAARLASRLKGMKVLFMSGYTGGTAVGGEGPLYPFIQKPFSAEQLIQKVCTVLSET